MFIILTPLTLRVLVGDGDVGVSCSSKCTPAMQHGIAKRRGVRLFVRVPVFGFAKSSLKKNVRLGVKGCDTRNSKGISHWTKWLDSPLKFPKKLRSKASCLHAVKDDDDLHRQMTTSWDWGQIEMHLAGFEKGRARRVPYRTAAQ